MSTASDPWGKVRSCKLWLMEAHQPMARNEQLIRQHKVMQLLEASRYGRTLEELRDELVKDLGLTNLHARTVRRDVDALQASGLDIQSEMLERGKVYKLGRVER